MSAKSLFQPKHIGFTLFFLSIVVFVIYHLWTFSEYENALFQGRWIR